jgi:hypothetical protein
MLASGVDPNVLMDQNPELVQTVLNRDNKEIEEAQEHGRMIPPNKQGHAKRPNNVPNFVRHSPLVEILPLFLYSLL